jgi:hypothetical protein
VLPIPVVPGVATDGVEETKVTLRKVIQAKVRCRKHDLAVGAIHVQRENERLVADCTPCCARSAKDVKATLQKLEAAFGRIFPLVASASSPGATPLFGAGLVHLTPPPPTVGVTGMRAVSNQVAAAYAMAGKLQHLVRTNGGAPEVFSAESADDEAATWTDGKVPPCTDENIRRFTKRLIAQVTELAMKEGRPLSDYGAIFDWDQMQINVDRVDEVRALFARAPQEGAPLIEQLDANPEGTMLVFVFAERRHQRTLTLTSRGAFIGHAGTA